MQSILTNALSELCKNQLAQVCNNLYCTIQDVKKYRSKFATDKKLYSIYNELEAEYNTLFKLIYGDKR